MKYYLIENRNELRIVTETWFKGYFLMFTKLNKENTMKVSKYNT